MVFEKDELAWSRIIELIPGLGPKSTIAILDTIKNINNPFALVRDPRKLIYNVKRKLRRVDEEALKYLSKLIRFLFKIDKGSVEIKLERLVKNELITLLITSKYKNSGSIEQRLEDLKQLPSLGKGFASEVEFLTKLKMQSQEDLENEEDFDKVVISTIHRAKGLEWHVVFVPSLIRGLFPDIRSIESEDDLEEERRVFYVAITRAKKRLFLSYNIESRGNKQNEVSQFIGEKEIQDILYDTLIIKKEQSS